MDQKNPRVILLAIGLTALAGFTDALGFIHLGGFFVSFMSGNSTRFAVETAEGNAHNALVPGGIILLFVTGVTLASLAGRRVPARHRPAAVLSAVTLLLGAAGMSHLAGCDVLAVACMVLAMGAENTVFERNGEVAIALTYMTGTLVKMGQRIAAALAGGPKFGWLRHLELWLGLVAGAIAGGFAYHHFGLNALWLAAFWAGGLTLVTARLGRNADNFR